MESEKILKELSFEEKTKLLTGSGSMSTYEIEKYGIKAIECADGPHGVRLSLEKNCTLFPSLCTLACSWDKEIARKMGRALADDCIENNINVLLGPGVNIKRHILCGRNFEYLSEDPVLAGELAAGYVDGLQEKGVSACVKHYALNNQEEARQAISVEIDERTLREIYLRVFEIIINKSNPNSIMCSYNKVNGIWCSENELLLKEILKDEWGYSGIVVSDWCAVQDPSRSVKAGLDLQMPSNPDITEMIKEGIKEGKVAEKDIDEAAKRIIDFAKKHKKSKIDYDREVQHKIAREIASESIVLLKNDNDVLPLTSQKYKKIALVGQYAVSPLINGQGSAEVRVSCDYIETPFDEMKKLLPDVELKYLEMYKKAELSEDMLWPKWGEFQDSIKDCDAVICFMGSMVSEDTENFDRYSAYINRNQVLFLRYSIMMGKKTVVVLQNGGAFILDDWIKKADAIVDMWLGGEAAGGAIADVLSGKVNPSGKLSETFPATVRRDLEYPGNGRFIEYKEKFDVGYRYYDKHPEEILFPFGHGLSYTTFEYKDLLVSTEDLSVSFTLKNTGNCDGAEVVQLYIGDREANVLRPLKELKQFEKIYLRAGEEKNVKFFLSADDLAYYNVVLHKWTVENGIFDIYIGSSSRDIRLFGELNYMDKMSYSLRHISEATIG